VLAQQQRRQQAMVCVLAIQVYLAHFVHLSISFISSISAVIVLELQFRKQCVLYKTASATMQRE
jgi:hypothetical protein